jgi:DNA-binding FrmR family transcriptional regulator
MAKMAEIAEMAETVRPISPDIRDDLLLRLRRIEGQMRGIQRMVEEGQVCRKIFHQITAIKAALTSASTVILECYTRNCLDDPSHTHDEIVTELIETIHKATR